MSYILKKEFTSKEAKKTADLIAGEIDFCLRTDTPSLKKGVLSAYLLYRASEQKKDCSYPELCENALNLDESILMEVKSYLTEQMWKDLLALTEKYSAKEFALTALLTDSSLYGMRREETETPDSLVKLSRRILNIQPGETVADLGCGCGGFLYKSAMEIPEARYYGYEIDYSSKLVAQIRAELLGLSMELEVRDAFTLPENQMGRFDKVFSNYPFGMKLRQLGEGNKLLERLTSEYSGMTKATSSDWVFNALLCELMNQDGKAIGIMTNGSTWNTIDVNMRKYFVEKGLVEAVISLPERMFAFVSIPTTMIVLSHGNHSVRMVDASEIYQKGRRNNEFSDGDIETILSALTEDREYSQCIPFERLRDNEYVLSPRRYLEKKIAIPHGVPFETVIQRISRGALCTAKQLDEMASDSVTNMQYLMLSNIQGGIIEDNLPYLSSIEPKYEKYCLKNNTLIISKNGYPYKIAVAKVKEGQQILANGNLYLIELNESVVNPYYLKAFFESELGVASLKSITVGATMPNIGVDNLKKLEVPVPPMEEQERIVQRYRANLDEIAVLKLKLARATSRLHHIFDEESGDENC